MAAGDLILSNGVAISPEDIRLIAEEAKKILASESKEITQYEQVSTLTNISSFPAILQQGTALKLVRVAMDLLKGVDGKNIELSSSSEAILWRLEGSQQWNTLVSLSYLKGDKGDKGDIGLPPMLEAGEVETKLPDTDVEVSVTDNGYTEDGRPKYKLNFKIPAGKPGQDGDGAGNVYVVTDNIKSGKRYVFQATSDASANGTFLEVENIEGVGKTYESIYPNGEIFNDYDNNIAFGQYAHAEGRETNATGSRAHAEGYLTRVFAADAHAEGRETWCLGAQGHSEGFYSIVFGASSHVEGMAYDTDRETPATKVILATKDEEFIRTLLANGDYFYTSDKAVLISDKLFEDFIIHAAFGERSHVEGTNNTCFDNSSHVEGFENRCGNMITGHGYALTHNANHVEGKYNYIGGTLEFTYAIHIEGNNNEFRGRYDYPTHAVHIEGQYNSIPLLTEGTSSCNGAHLGGEYSKVIGGRSTFAHGYNLSVKNNYEAAFGKYNASEVDGKSVLFAYGVGTSDTDRKNAISVFADGSVEIPNLTGVAELAKVEEKFAELENKLNEELNALQNKIIGIYNKLSIGDITNNVFVINDTLIITDRIDANVEGTDLAINDEMFIFTDGGLSYNSNK